MGSTGNSVGTDSDDVIDNTPLPPGWERIADPQYGVFYMEFVHYFSCFYSGLSLVLTFLAFIVQS